MQFAENEPLPLSIIYQSGVFFKARSEEIGVKNLLSLLIRRDFNDVRFCGYVPVLESCPIEWVE